MLFLIFILSSSRNSVESVKHASERVCNKVYQLIIPPQTL